jgi:mRNA-degrading endonuclease toxin of MazEF toxin-antitoxin module
MVPGDVYLANFPYGGSAGGKLRPVLLLTPPVGSVPDLVTAYTSSVIPLPLLASDIVLDAADPDHASTRLKTVSVLRLHKVATIHQRSAVRYLGQVSAAAFGEVQNRLRSLLNL